MLGKGSELLEEFIATKRPMMCRWARQILSRQEDAEDSVQIALTQAALTINRYDPQRGPFAPWLRKYVRRAAMNLARSRRTPEVMMGLIVLETSPDQARDVADTVCETAEQEELMARAYRVLCLLPPDVQHALWKVSRGEMSMEQVGELMHCTPNAAAVRLFRIRRTVKELVS